MKHYFFPCCTATPSSCSPTYEGPFELTQLPSRALTIGPFIPVKIETSTCEIASAALSILFLGCVCVVNQNTRVLLLLVFCYSYAK